MNHPTPLSQLLFLVLPARVGEDVTARGWESAWGGAWPSHQGAWPGHQGAGLAGGCALIGGGAGFRRRVL